MSSSGKTGRYLSLDHWRGFAALWVLIFHANRGEPLLEPFLIGDFVSYGWLGVSVFFVISGYCIAERMAREAERGGAGGYFLIDRLLRIYPPYWVSILLTLAVNAAGAYWKGQPLSTPYVMPEGALGWLTAIMCVEPWLGRGPYQLVAWTLAYEIGFYCCAAAGLALMRASRRRWPGPVWWGLLLAIGLSPLSAWFPLLQLWPQFALGGIVWFAWHGSRPLGLRLSLGGAGIALISVVCFCASQGQMLALQTAVVCAALLLVLRCWDEQLATLPALRWLGWVGTFSYSLYLAHAPLVGKFAFALEHGLLPGEGNQRLAVIIISCACTVPCTWLFYRFIELKCESFRRSTMARLTSPSP